jgi:hypothetical protein
MVIDMFYLCAIAAGWAIIWTVRDASKARDELICRKNSDNLFEKLQPKFGHSLSRDARQAGLPSSEKHSVD